MKIVSDKSGRSGKPDSVVDHHSSRSLVAKALERFVFKPRGERYGLNFLASDRVYLTRTFRRVGLALLSQHFQPYRGIW